MTNLSPLHDSLATYPSLSAVVILMNSLVTIDLLLGLAFFAAMCGTSRGAHAWHGGSPLVVEPMHYYEATTRRHKQHHARC
jgi:hypothetical protein